MDITDFPSKAEQLIFSPEFIELNNIVRYRTPNFWHIIGIARKEVYISRFLAWILDPEQDHSLGDRFLRAFLAEALRTEQGKRSNVLPIEMEVADLMDAEVSPESFLGSRRCDILIASHKKKLLVITENKIDAKESSDQTKDYYQQSLELYNESQYPNRIYIFLTPNGEPAKSDKFISISYQDVLQTIGVVLKQSRLDEHTQFLLNQFKDNIQRGIAMDQRTRDLIDDIYEKYGDVIRFIIQNVDQDFSGQEITDSDSSWDGKTWFLNTGDNTGYAWDDYRKYGFICAGGGKRYRELMNRFKNEDIVFAYISKFGYVGIGLIVKQAVPFRDAELPDGRLIQDLPDLKGKYTGGDNLDACDWISLVKWEVNVEKSQAVKEPPITPGTACRILESRKPLIDKVRHGLKKSSDTNR